MNNLKELHNLYPLLKTLRFKLIPEGKTQSFIDKNRFLESDEHRAQSYKEAKKIIDEYLKVFIEECLSNCKLEVCDNGKGDSLAEFFIAYKNKDVKAIETIQAKLRKQIASSFQKNEKFKQLAGKELITDLLPKSIVDSRKREVINEFNKFVTYFDNFNTCRENMYT
ncbi:MAG: type V CRISPR-associated protein Cas12a/Cpf1, partial [Tannerellaceae bacterium]